MDIRVCTLEILDEAVLFAASRNRIVELRCRPFLIDTSIETIRKNYLDFIEGDSKDILLQYEEGSLVGVTGIYWISEDSYLSFTRGIFFEGDYNKIATGFINYLNNKFSGYNLYINTTREHAKAVEFYANNGFELLEDAEMYTMKDYAGFEVEEGIEYLDDMNMEIICNHLETIMTPNTYWNTERVLGNLEKFIIIGYFNQDIEGALYAQIYKDRSVEIFGIAAEETVVIEMLIKALICKCGMLKSRRLWLYTDVETEVKLAVKMGFEFYDSNKCYMKSV